jgi:hypothetical protein
MTGRLEEEKLHFYVRLGIKLLYKVRILTPCISISYQFFLQGAKSRMEGARGKRCWLCVAVRVLTIL